MTASLLNGKEVSSLLKNEIKTRVESIVAKGMRPPALAVILVGDDPASAIYVNTKSRACKEVGLNSVVFNLPSNTSEEKVLDLIDELNNSSTIDGILVQLPLPLNINTDKIIEKIAPYKDVDGFHPYNLGRLALRNPFFRPCTPAGIMKLLTYYQIPIKRSYAVIIGASTIVGRPMALEFLLAGATVTVCHRFTTDLEKHVRAADILVVATGVPDIVNPEWLNLKQIVVDVGIHRLADGRLRGDINYEKACQKVAWITPVPGGVGPMTIAFLLQNTLMAAELLLTH